MSMGSKIERLLRERGMTQVDLAKQVGVTQQTIWKLVTGASQGSKHIHKIARALRTTPEYLTGEINDPDVQLVLKTDGKTNDGSPKVADRRLPFKSAVSANNPGIVEVAFIDLNFGLGAAFMDQEIVAEQAERIPFAYSWLRAITSSPIDQLYWSRGVGDSMEPVIGDGDVILIDRSAVGSSFGDVYWAIAYGQTGMIKRLRPMPDGSVKILSNNASVPPEIAYDGELHIFGRVVAVINRI